MNKQEIEQEIRETREKLEALEARLKEPEKWKPMGGDWRAVSTTLGLEAAHDPAIHRDEKYYRAQSQEACVRLANHLETQALLWQLAESLNDGWVPDWEDANQLKFEVFYDHKHQDWSLEGWLVIDHGLPVFKNRSTAEKARQILNKQGVIDL